MSRQSVKRLRDVELMGEDIVGLFLSTEPLHDMNRRTTDDEPKLWRFIHDQENIEHPQFIGSGKHGVVVLGSIKGNDYALKVVSISPMTLLLN